MGGGQDFLGGQSFALHLQFGLPIAQCCLLLEEVGLYLFLGCMHVAQKLVLIALGWFMTIHVGELERRIVQTSTGKERCLTVLLLDWLRTAWLGMLL